MSADPSAAAAAEAEMELEAAMLGDDVEALDLAGDLLDAAGEVRRDGFSLSLFLFSRRG